MKKTIEILQHRRLLIVLVCLLSLGAVSATGCAGRTKTSTVTVQTSEGSAGGTTTSVTTQTQKQVVTDAHPRGVIGGIFYTVGQIIAWPFKVIGSLFS